MQYKGGYTTQDLINWDKQIQEKAEEFGLSYYPVEFMLTDAQEMMGYMAYVGMTSRYPHWSFGKAYERTKTMYDLGVTGLAYEMVINSNPSIAYLMKDNTKLLQILTMAHVYGHVDFFKNNFNFKNSPLRAEHTIEKFKAHAQRIRGYMKDPSIGIEAVEVVLDAAHAICMNCQRNFAVKKLTMEQQQDKEIERATPDPDPFWKIHKRPEPKEPELHKLPIEPDDDILLFIRDYNPFLEDWVKDILTIVDEEIKYFIPQIDTKIMNEGWASYWHYKILNSLDLPPELQMEFAVNHSQVVCPHKGHVNPYYVGFTMWRDIVKRFGEKEAFAVRESERDTSFIRRFMTKELVRELHLVEYGPKEDFYVVDKVADRDDENWKSIRDTMAKNTGMGNVPVIRVVDSGFGTDQILRLEHVHDGRDLFLEYLDATIRYITLLWNRPVHMETQLEGRKVVAICQNPNENVEFLTQKTKRLDLV